MRMKRVFKRILVAFVLLGVLLLACQRVEERKQQRGDGRDGLFEEARMQKGLWKIAGLQGPMSIGMVRMIDDHFASAEMDFTIYKTREEIKDGLLSGELGIASIPANLASIIYNKTGGQYKVAAINTMGVTTILEKGREIEKLQDLKGKRMAAIGKGAVPGLTLRIMLNKVGLDMDRDVKIIWKRNPSEVFEWLKEDGNDIAMLPQPFATGLMKKISDLRTALDLGDEWNKLKLPGDFITGVLVVHKDIAEQQRERFLDFLKEYEQSIYFVKLSVGAPALVAKYGIIEDDIAKKALPNLEIIYMDGLKMKEELSAYLKTLYNQDPSCIGDSLPGEDFYFLP